MKPGPRLAAKRAIGYIAIDEPPISALQLLGRIIEGEAWATHRDEVQEMSSLWETRFLRALQASRLELLELGRQCRFDFNSSSDYLIQGSAFVEPKDNEDLAKSKRGRARFDQYRSAIDSLSPKDFEALCKGILVALGGIEIRVTPYQADDGIDFYCKIKLESALFPNHPIPNVGRQLMIWVVGQAKHYQLSNVRTPDIRELVGSVELAKGKAFVNLRQEFRNMEIRTCDPVYFLFITSGFMSGDVWQLLQKSGVIGMDGEMVASFLAERGIGVDSDAFCQDEFSSWIASQSQAEN